MRRLLTVLLVSWIGFATAQAPAETGFLGIITDVDTWFTELTEFVGRYQTGFESMAYALAALGLTVTVISILGRGSLTALNGAMIKVLFVGGLIATAPALTTLSTDAWIALRGWSGQEMEATFSEAADEMQQLGNDAGILAMAGAGGASGLLALSSKQAAYAAGQASASAATNLLNFAVFPVVVLGAIAHFIILASGVSIVAAGTFMPVAAGMLAFSPEQGASWMGRVVSAIVTGLLLTAFMPLIFKAVFDLAVVQPITVVNEQFAEFSDFYAQDSPLAPPPRLAEIERKKAELQAEMARLYEDLEPWKVWANASAATRIEVIKARLPILDAEALVLRGQWTSQQLGSLSNAYDAIANQVQRWMFRMILFAIGLFLATGMMWWAATSVANLAGGMVASRIGSIGLGDPGSLLARGGYRAGRAKGAAAAGGSSSHRVSSVTPSYSGGPSGGGASTVRPPPGSSSTPAPAGGGATASLPNMRGSSSNGTASPGAGGNSSTTTAPTPASSSTSAWLTEQPPTRSSRSQT